MPNGSHVRSIAPLSVISSRAVTPLAIGAAAVPISNRARIRYDHCIDLQLRVASGVERQCAIDADGRQPSRNHAVDLNDYANRYQHARPPQAPRRHATSCGSDHAPLRIA